MDSQRADGGSSPSNEGVRGANPVATESTASRITITGRVVFDGDRPTPRPIQMGLDAACAAHGTAGPVTPPGLTIAEDGGLPYVFVYVRKGAPDDDGAPPTAPVTLEQRGCMFEPHVFGLQVGQPLRIINSDPTIHNVHSRAEKNTGFNLSQPRQGMTSTQTFTRPEIMVRLKCDVHGWMDAYVGVLRHPYFAVTDAGGRYELPALPPGEYEIEAWHELWGTREQTVQLSDTDATITADFTFARPTR